MSGIFQTLDMWIYALTAGVDADRCDTTTPLLWLTFPALAVTVVGFTLIGAFVNDGTNRGEGARS